MFHCSINVNNILLPDILHQILTSMDNIFELFIFYIREVLKKRAFQRRGKSYRYIYICEQKHNHTVLLHVSIINLCYSGMTSCQGWFNWFLDHRGIRISLHTTFCPIKELSNNLMGDEVYSVVCLCWTVSQGSGIYVKNLCTCVPSPQHSI